MELIKGNIETGGKMIVCLDPYKKDYLVLWDKKVEVIEEVENTSYMAERFKKLPTLEEVQPLILGYYNSLCDDEIKTGLFWDGSRVWLTTENQFNYKAAFDFAFQTKVSGGEYMPVTVKLGEEGAPVYRTFVEFDELQEFITACFSHVQSTLVKYWGIKDAIDWTLYEM